MPVLAGRRGPGGFEDLTPWALELLDPYEAVLSDFQARLSVLPYHQLCAAAADMLLVVGAALIHQLRLAPA